MGKKKRTKKSSKKSLCAIVCICVFFALAGLAFATMFMPFRTVSLVGNVQHVSAVDFLQNVESYRAAIDSEALNKVFVGAVMLVIVASICGVLSIGAILSLLAKKEQKMISRINAIASAISVLIVVVAIIVANNGMQGFNVGSIYKYVLGAAMYVLLGSLVVMSGTAFVVGKK